MFVFVFEWIGETVKLFQNKNNKIIMASDAPINQLKYCVNIMILWQCGISLAVLDLNTGGGELEWLSAQTKSKAKIIKILVFGLLQDL